MTITIFSMMMAITMMIAALVTVNSSKKVKMAMTEDNSYQNWQ